MTIPKLRFKDESGGEFPQWEQKRLGNITVELKDTVDPSCYKDKTFVEYSMPAFDNNQRPMVVYGKDMHSIRKTISEPCLLVNKLNVRKKRIWLHKEFEPNAVCSTEFVALGSNGVIDLHYLKQLALTNHFTEYLINNSSGTSNSQKRVSPATILNYKAFIPVLPEQEKIADFLTSYDAMIDNQSKRVDVLKLRQKGLLHKIFSQEIRFRDENGQEFPAWEEKRLGEIFEQVNAYALPSDENRLYSLTVENGIVEKSARYDRSFLVKKNDKFKLVKPNEFVYNPMNMTIGAVGYNLFNKNIVVSGYYVVMKTSDRIGDYYWYNWLKSFEAIKLFKKYATGSLIEKQRIQFPTFMNIRALVPSADERQKIADFLTAVDKQINVEEKRLETMKTIKKGLLQQLFV